MLQPCRCCVLSDLPDKALEEVAGHKAGRGCRMSMDAEHHWRHFSPCTVTKGVRISIPAEVFQVATGLPESEINVPSPSVENV